MSMPSLSYAEKRRSPRVLRLRKARCVFNNGSSSLDVTLRNISFTGANIVSFTADTLISLPPTFEFQILDGFGGYSGHHARLVWSRGATAGIEFTDWPSREMKGI
jgi:PilZ domain